MIGDYLRKCREAANLSLEELSATTMIKLSYLKALEDENFNALPCEVFTKGYIRVYLESLSLDSSEGMRILQQDGVYQIKSSSKSLGKSLVLSQIKSGDVAAGSVKAEPGTTTSNSTSSAAPVSNTERDNRNYSYYSDRSGYMRNLVYLIVFLAVLAVIVYSSSKLFSIARAGSATATTTLESGDSQALRHMQPPAKRQQSLQPSGQPSDKPHSSVSSQPDKKTETKSSNSKKTTHETSDKIKESLNFMEMSTAEASIPTKSLPLVEPKPAANNKPDLKEITRTVKKMKDMTASLKSLKASIETTKALAPSNDVKSANPAPTNATDMQPSNPQTTAVVLPDAAEAKQTTSVARSKEMPTSELFEASPFSQASSSVSELNIQSGDKTEKCELSEKGDTF